MIRKILMTLVFVVGLPAAAAAAPSCNTPWSGQGAEAIASFQVWMQSRGAYDVRRERYDPQLLAETILREHVMANCAEAHAALRTQGGQPVSDDQYVQHLLRLNFAGQNGRVPRRISQDAMIQLLAGPGINLGLPIAQARPASPAPNQRRVAPTQRRATPPACGWCDVDPI